VFAPPQYRAIRVAAGAYHVCAVFSNGGVRCWGDNTYGNLGRGNTATWGALPGEMALLGDIAFATPTERAVDISAVAHHTCALFAGDLGARCWGRNDYGQLGLGHTNAIGDDATDMTSLGFLSFSTSERVIQIGAGEEFSVALFADGSIRAFGRNDYFELGGGSANVHLGDNPSEMAALHTVVASGAISIVAGIRHSCAVVVAPNTMRKFACFGDNGYGQLGDGSTTTDGSFGPEHFFFSSFLNPIVEAAAFHFHTCVTHAKWSTLRCFGRGDTGYLGQGNTDTIGATAALDAKLEVSELSFPSMTRIWPTAAPLEPASAVTITVFGSGFDPSGSSGVMTARLALISTGTGSGGATDNDDDDNDDDDDDDDACSPGAAASMTDMVLTAVNTTMATFELPHHSTSATLANCSRHGARALVTIAVDGSHFMGSTLRDGATLTLFGTPAVTATNPTSAPATVSLVTVFGFNFSVTGSGGARCIWTCTEPVSAGVEAGGMYSAMTEAFIDPDGDGTTAAAAANASLPLALEALVCYTPAQPSLPPSGVPACTVHVSLDAGRHRSSTAAVFAFNDAAAWLPRFAARDGGSASGLGVAVGDNHYCVRVGGIMQCYGSGLYGKLGNGMATALVPPGDPNVRDVVFGDATPVRTISLGDFHSCAVFANGGIKCFGKGNGPVFGSIHVLEFGEVGDEAGEMETLDFFALTTPTASIVDVGVGTAHACALFSTGQVKCWGSGASGSLGEESTEHITFENFPHVRGDFVLFDGSPIPTLDTIVVQLSVGYAHNCVVFAHGGVRCFGQHYGAKGCLGTDGLSSVGGAPGDVGAAVDIAFSSSHRAVAVSCGTTTTCVLFDNGRARCFGEQLNGALGTGKGDDVGNAPGHMGALEFIELGSGGGGGANANLTAQISTSGPHTCALMQTGTVRCWGYGPLLGAGLGDSVKVGRAVGEMTAIADIPFEPGFGRVVHIATSPLMTCAASVTSQVKCWGNVDYTGNEYIGDAPGEMETLASIPIETLSLLELSPAVAAGEVGGSAANITVRGTGLLSGTSIVVRFTPDASTVAAGCAQSPVDRAVALTPPYSGSVLAPNDVWTCGHGSAATVSISRDGSQFTSARKFTFFAQPNITAIEPSGGPITGATVVTVSGERIFSSESILCTFVETGTTGGALRHVVPGTAVISTVSASASVITCPTPTGGALSAPGPVTVQVSMDGGTTEALFTDGTFFVHNATTVTGISNARGIASGGTPVTVSLDPTAVVAPSLVDRVVVRVASSSLVSELVTDTTFDRGNLTVSFLTPSFAAYASDGFFPHKVQISVSLNGGQQFTAPAPGGGASLASEFEYVADPILIAVNPSSIPADNTAQTELTLLGANFLDRGTSIVVLVGTATLAGSFDGPSNGIRATLPASLGATAAPGTYNVRVSLNAGLNFSPETITLVRYLATSIAPAGGPMTGGTVVTVLGAGFSPTPTLRCLFGSGAVIAQAVFVSSSAVLCTTPAVTTAASVSSVRVSVDGVLATLSSSPATDFTYHGPLNITAISPALGPSGATAPLIVTLTAAAGSGSGAISTGLGAAAGRCRIGGADTAFAAITSLAITCAVADGVGESPVLVALNGVDFQTLAGLKFAFYHLVTVSPTLGPVAGGTRVIITGTGFATPPAGHADYAWQCRFGGQTSSESLSASPSATTSGTVVAAAVVSITQLECTVPAGAGLGAGGTAVPLAISAGGDRFAEAAASPVLFSLYETPVVSAVWPKSGPAAGGTVVTITGTGLAAFSAAHPVLVRFGSGSTRVEALKGGTATMLTVIAPAGEGTVDVTVSLNGQDYSGGPRGLFSYFVLTRIEPSLGSEVGGTEVTVTGLGFGDLDLATSKCRFGTVVVRALRYIDPVRFVCAVPPAATFASTSASSTTVAVAITTNDVTFSSAPGVDFTYHRAPRAVSLDPTSGPAAGGFVVTLGVDNVPPAATNLTTRCYFGDSSVPADIDSSRHLVVCSSAPPGAGTTTVRVTFNLRTGPADVTWPAERLAYFSVREISPVLGPVDGGTNVTVHGEGFSRNAPYECRIGSSSGSLAPVAIATAVYRTSTELICALPSMAQKRQQQPSSTNNTDSLQLTVGVAGLQFAAGNEQQQPTGNGTVGNSGGASGGSAAIVALAFQTYVSPTISAIVPSSLPSSGGAVTLYGTGFNALTACRFSLAGSAVDAPRVSGNTTAVICRAQPHPKAIGQRVLVSNNGQVFHTAPLYVTLNFTACAVGHFAELDTDKCEPCPPGHSAAAEASRKCEPCDAGGYTVGAGAAKCERCPAGTSVRSGQGDGVDKCVCNPGFHNPTGTPGAECVPCDEGALCPGFSATAQPKESFWASTVNPYAMVRCPNPDACVGGGVEACASGYLGRMCTVCADGFYVSGPTVCSQCPNNGPWLVIAYAAFCVLLTIAMVRFAGRRIKAYAGTVGIAVTYFQVLAMLTELNVEWPVHVVRSARALTAAFTLNVNILASECSMPGVTYASKWVFVQSLPPLFLALFALIYAVGALRLRLTGRPTSELLSSVINAYVMLLALAYLRLVSTAFELFACVTQADGEAALVADPSRICYRDWWWRLFPCALAAILVYGLGIPVAIVVLMRRNAHRTSDPGFAARYGSLYAAYRAHLPWWEAVVMIEKSAIALSGMLLAGFVSVQLAVLGMVFSLTLVLYNEFQPFVRAEDNRLRAILRWSCLAIVAAGHAFHTNDFPNDSTRRVAVGFAVAIIITGTTAVTASVARNLARIYREHRIAVDSDLAALLDAIVSPQGKRKTVRFLRVCGPVMAARIDLLVQDLRAFLGTGPGASLDDDNDPNGTAAGYTAARVVQKYAADRDAGGRWHARVLEGILGSTFQRRWIDRIAAYLEMPVWAAAQKDGTALVVADDNDGDDDGRPNGENDHKAAAAIIDDDGGVAAMHRETLLMWSAAIADTSTDRRSRKPGVADDESADAERAAFLIDTSTRRNDRAAQLVAGTAPFLATSALEPAHLWSPEGAAMVAGSVRLFWSGRFETTVRAQLPGQDPRLLRGADMIYGREESGGHVPASAKDTAAGGGGADTGAGAGAGESGNNNGLLASNDANDDKAVASASRIGSETAAGSPVPGQGAPRLRDGDLDEIDAMLLDSGATPVHDFRPSGRSPRSANSVHPVGLASPKGGTTTDAWAS
jgi:alpha-tubulin suppressor-like RCC1 family protein